MKVIVRLIQVAAIIVITVLCAVKSGAAETNAVPLRVGIYDSRAVAYAWFSSSNSLQSIAKMVREARAAKAAGDSKQFEEMRANLRRLQKQMHREVFSTAPAVEALARLDRRLPEIESAAGVSALVSKWDNAGLKKYRGAEQVDVTDRMVEEFRPTAKQLEMISQLEKSKPSRWMFE